MTALSKTAPSKTARLLANILPSAPTCSEPPRPTYHDMASVLDALAPVTMSPQLGQWLGDIVMEQLEAALLGHRAVPEGQPQRPAQKMRLSLDAALMPIDGLQPCEAEGPKPSKHWTQVLMSGMVPSISSEEVLAVLQCKFHLEYGSDIESIRPLGNGKFALTLKTYSATIEVLSLDGAIIPALGSANAISARLMTAVWAALQSNAASSMKEGSREPESQCRDEAQCQDDVPLLAPRARYAGQPSPVAEGSDGPYPSRTPSPGSEFAYHFSVLEGLLDAAGR